MDACTPGMTAAIPNGSKADGLPKADLTLLTVNTSKYCTNAHEASKPAAAAFLRYIMAVKVRYHWLVMELDATNC